MGYSQNSKAYRRYYPKTGRILISRNIFFIKLKDDHPHPFRPGIEIGNKGDPATDDPFRQIKTERGDIEADAHDRAMVENRGNGEPHPVASDPDQASDS